MKGLMGDPPRRLPPQRERHRPLAHWWPPTGSMGQGCADARSRRTAMVAVGSALGLVAWGLLRRR